MFQKESAPALSGQAQPAARCPNREIAKEFPPGFEVAELGMELRIPKGVVIVVIETKFRVTA